MVTSFGSLSDRPALFVEVEGRDGSRGWGEVWCNFPAFAGEHRAQFMRDVIAPLFVATTVDTRPRPAAESISCSACRRSGRGRRARGGSRCRPRPGAWDLIARRQGLPLWRMLGGSAKSPRVRSGIDPDQAVETVTREHEAGIGRSS